MSAKQTVTDTQESQVPADTGQFNTVPIKQTQIQQDPSSKTQKSKKNNQTGTVWMGTSSAITATTGTVQRTRTYDINLVTWGPSNPKETMGTVGGTGPPKQHQAGKLGPQQSLQQHPTHLLRALEHSMHVFLNHRIGIIRCNVRDR